MSRTDNLTNEEEPHRSPSPAGHAELFFFSEALSSSTQQISALALSSALHTNVKTRPGSSSSFITGTSGYITAEEEEISISSIDLETTTVADSSVFSPLNKELTNGNSAHKTVTFADNDDNDMANKKKSSVKGATSVAHGETPAAPVVADPVVTGPHVSSQAYEGVKDVWTWAANDFVLSKPFLKTAENVAAKLLSTQGLDLEKVDSVLKPVVAQADDILDPAITKVIEVVMPYAEKVLVPVGLIKKVEDESNAAASSELEATAVVQQ